MTDPNNCGAVGITVHLPKANMGCVQGRAAVLSCDAGWEN